MRHLIVYQVGDVHYPQHQDDRAIDVKATGIPAPLIEAIAPPSLQVAIRDLATRITDSSSESPAIVFCGDLTSFGQLAPYQTCVSFFASNLQLDVRTRWPLDSIHAVPGNHDIDRDRIPVNNTNLLNKFVPLERSWIDQHVPVLSGRLRRTTIGQGGVAADLYSINSCIGCGEWRSTLKTFSKKMGTAFMAVARSAKAKKSMDLWEQLDTPAFMESDIDQLLGHIGQAPKSHFQVITTHHNLLPQALPRVMVLGDLLNGGVLRERLCRSGIPIAYLHGHIHTSPVEVISQPERLGGLLVTIAAPEFTRGFNRIDVEFSSDNVPIGIVVQLIRSQDSGRFEDAGEIRVPLTSGSARPSELLSATIAVLGTIGGRVRFPDLHDSVRVKGHRPTGQRLADSLQEGEWLGLLRIHDRGDEPKFWQAERTGTR